jgi:hypothetical protein
MPGITKPWWSDKLSELKRLSIEAHALWSTQGRPRFGVFNDNRLLCKSRYKKALRDARTNFEHCLTSKLASKLLCGDAKAFWAKWNAQFGLTKNVNSCIAGMSKVSDIADGFAHYFESNFYDSASNISLLDQFHATYEDYVTKADSCCVMFSMLDVKSAIMCLKKEKAAGLDGITPEMIIYAGDSLVTALVRLFNMCILHGYVPVNFSTSIIVPVIKDKTGKCDSFDNYRPISLVSMFSKVLELCFSVRLATLLQVDELQFGFVPGKGCQKALFALNSTVNYFVSRGSPVYTAALDASKAFDRVNHYALFCKLMSIGVPVYMLNVLIDWHLKLSGCVLWCGVLSYSFVIKSGVRQGGINSPWFFNVYINDLIIRLRSSGYGCYLWSEFIGCLFFADDILILSGSIWHLQFMLQICEDYGVEFDIKFNQSKSFLCQFGLDHNVILPELFLCGIALCWVDRLKYLGVWLVSGKKFHIDASVNCTKFLGSVIGIMQKCGRVSEEIKWHVIQHSCLPILLYGVDSVVLHNEQIRKLSVAYNNAVRRCFVLSRFSSVRNVLFYMGSSPLNMILDQRRVLLLKECLKCEGVLRLFALMYVESSDFFNLCCTYDVHCGMSKFLIKSCFIDMFSKLLHIDGVV